MYRSDSHTSSTRHVKVSQPDSHGILIQNSKMYKESITTMLTNTINHVDWYNISNYQLKITTKP